MTKTTQTFFVKLILGIGLVLFLASPALAQPQVEMNKDYLIEEFVLPGGPSGNSVNCIVQGPKEDIESSDEFIDKRT